MAHFRMDGQSAFVHVAAYCLLMLMTMMGCRPDSPSQKPSTPTAAPSVPASRIQDEPKPATTKQPAPTDMNQIRPRFEDISRKMGLDFTFFNDDVPDRFFLPEVMGGGVAWIDFDRDGWLDLFQANGCELHPESEPGSGKRLRSTRPTVCHLSRNRMADRFEDVSDASHASVELYGQGCAVGDFDGDGFDDLFIAGFGRDRLLHNHGDGTFQDVTGTAGVSDLDWTTSAVWFDVDADGDLDLYAVNYMNVNFRNTKACQYEGRPGYCGPGSYEAVPDRAYLNQGDGTFVESAENLGLIGEDGKGLAVIAVDFDDDCIPELYVANDMTANFLFTRGAPSKGQPLYREVARTSGVAVSGTGMNEASMGIAIADFNGDERPDIYLTHYYRMKNTLYSNLGSLLFDDDSYRSKVAVTSLESLGFGTSPIDFDRDGDPDLLIANGHVLGPLQQPNKMPPQLLRNDSPIFTDISPDAGEYFTTPWIGRSVAAADFDNDGDLDFAVSHLGSPSVLLANHTDCGQRPFLSLELTSIDGQPAVGGRVRLKTSRRQITTPITAGGSYLAASDRRLLFGWKDDERLESVDVFWPSGRKDTFSHLEPNHFWSLREGRQPVNHSFSTQPINSEPAQSR